jgi:hypothetical protein
MNVVGKDYERSDRASGARLTFFHVLWLVTALAAGGIVFAFASGTHIVGRIALTIASAVGGFLLAIVLVTWLVSTTALRRNRPGTYWHHEADIYMRSIFGNMWKQKDG